MFGRSKNDEPGTGRWVRAVVIAATAVAVVSLAIVGTVAAQSGQRFRDVPRTHYAYTSIEWAFVNGITEGCGDGRYFCPDDTLNRAQMVTFLKRYHDEFFGATSTTTTTTTTTTVPEDFVLDGFGSGYFDSVTLPEGRYRVSIAVALNYTFPKEGDLDGSVNSFHPIEEVTVMAGGPNTATDRIILEFEPEKVAVADGNRPTTTRWTARGTTNLIIRRGLLEVPPGRVDFTVTLDPASNPLDALKSTDLSVANAVWQITVFAG